MAGGQFGSFEHWLAKVLSSCPGLKQRVKKTYQTINYYLHRKPYAFQSDLPMTRVGDGPFGEFFGYFQNSPCRNGQAAYLVPSKASLKYRECFPVDVVVNGKKVSESTAWNWQQGCMLWWLNDHEICHNSFEQGCYRAKVVHLPSSEIRQIEMPLCAVSADGKTGYSVDFEHIARLNPDYGYFCRKTSETSGPCDALHAIDLAENRVTASLTMQAVLDLDFRSSFNKARHEINHVAVSPDGRRIMFIHRWYETGKKRQSRLITANHDLTDLYCLADGGMVSHCAWKGDSQIVGWMQLEEGPHYYLLHDHRRKHEVVGNGILDSDGHPTVIDDRWILTDTYPNRARMSQLLLYHLTDHKLIKLGDFFSPLKFWGANRCDLHPKYAAESRSMFFESVHTGQRCLYQMDLANVLDSADSFSG